MAKKTKKKFKGRRSFASPCIIPPAVPDLCPECGEEGKHFVSGGSMFSDMWICPNKYGEDGKRKPEHMTIPDMGIDGLAGLLSLATFGKGSMRTLEQCAELTAAREETIEDEEPGDVPVPTQF